MTKQNAKGHKPGESFSVEQYQMLLRCSNAGDLGEWEEWRKTHAHPHPDSAIRLAGANLRGAELEGVQLVDVNASLKGALPFDANLAGADLEGANLKNAALVKANLEGAVLVKADLSGAALLSANLKSAALSEANLDGAMLADANLAGAVLEEASLARVVLVNANLAGAKLADANVAGSDLGHANLEAADLSRANLRATDLAGANLSGAVLSRADLRDVDLTGANLKGADLVDADLRGAKLAEANLAGAMLVEANLSGVELARANLENADLEEANLAGANLSGATLRGANLPDADLEDANLAGADLRGAELWHANLRGVDLENANLVGANVKGANLEGADLRGLFEQRKYYRVRCGLNAVYSVIGADDPDSVSPTLDVGLGGVRFNVRHEIAPGRMLRLNIRDSENKLNLDLKGMVAWCSQSKSKRSYEVGVQFPKLTPIQCENVLDVIGREKEYKGQQKRRYVRIKGHLSVQMHKLGGLRSKELLGSTTDISLGGMSVESRKKYKKGVICSAAVFLPAEAEPAVVTSRVLSVSPRRDGKHWLMRLRFEAFEGNARAQITNFLRATIGGKGGVGEPS